ncbi:hypothetical protein BX070DRAFT_250865 [Coemansia spiralis]|nr:hypothetical protein BX070DRAFT_250865 [Coemansia spiralis]
MTARNNRLTESNITQSMARNAAPPAQKRGRGRPPKPPQEAQLNTTEFSDGQKQVTEDSASIVTDASSSDNSSPSDKDDNEKVSDKDSIVSTPVLQSAKSDDLVGTHDQDHALVSNQGSANSGDLILEDSNGNNVGATVGENGKSYEYTMSNLEADKLLLGLSQVVSGDAYDRYLAEDQIDSAIQSLASQGSVADLVVIEYISQCILDEVSVLNRLLEEIPFDAPPTTIGQLTAEGGGEISIALQRLDCLAREQTMFRRHHFTYSLFLENKHRPVDETDIVKWSISLRRINLATFALLVFRPQIVVIESVGQNMPNRERMLTSLGLEAAAHAFFAHIVPSNQRGDDALELLVDMQTQKWLLAANDEAHLQDMVVEERSASENAIEKLLYIYPRIDAERAPSASDSQPFDSYGVSRYRSEINRRLNKISGGKLHITRSQYSLGDLWKKIAAFCGECASTVPSPTIYSAILAKPVDNDPSFLDEADDDNDVHSQSMQTSVQSSVSGAFEVTIYKDKEAETNPDAVSADDLEKDKELGGNGGAREHVPIDPSFLEERRVAVLLRDALADVHLDELMTKIDPEHIDISQALTAMRTPKRLHVAQFTQEQQAAEDGSGADGSEFRLGTGGEVSDWDAESNSSINISVRKQAQRRIVVDEKSTGANSRGRKRRSVADSEDEYTESSDDDYEYTSNRARKPKALRKAVFNEFAEEGVDQVMSILTTSARRNRIQYSSPKLASSNNGEFRGRRGIAAEDISDLARSHMPVKFTQSDYGSPELGDGYDSTSEAEDNRQPNHAEASTSESVAIARLGQYRPAQHMRNESVQTDDIYSEAGGREWRRESSISSSIARTSKPIQRRTRWSQDEEECFVRAVYKYGNSWTTILYHHGLGGVDDEILKRRNRAHLKDKARNIKIRLMREGKELGPFADACGHL